MLGDFTKRLRDENKELMLDMAKKLDVTVSFLSKVENGKSKPPKVWKEKISDIYKLNVKQIAELEKCFFKAVYDECVDISEYGKKDRDLILEFLFQYKTFDVHTKERLNNFLKVS